MESQGQLNTAALAAFISSPDSSEIINGMALLPPAVRSTVVAHISALASSFGAPKEMKLIGAEVSTRVAERRLKGETIRAISDAENIPQKDVQAYLREAVKGGLQVTIYDPKPNFEPAAKKATRGREIYSEDVKDAVVADRIAGYPPSLIAIARNMKISAVNRFINISGKTIPPLSNEAKVAAFQKRTDWRPPGILPENVLQFASNA